MKQNIIKLCSKVALLTMLFTIIITLPTKAVATPIISASTVKGEYGSTVDVIISLDSNPGIWSMGLIVGYDHSVLTLKGYTAGSIFTSSEVTQPPSLDKETYFFLASREKLEDTKETGTLVKLTFSLAAKADYKDYPITLELSNGNTINAKSQNVSFNTTNGKVTLVNCIHASSTWTTVTPATCEKSGVENLVCNKCKEVLNTRTIAKSGHNFTKKVISDKTKRSDATANEKATYFYTCQNSNDISTTLYFTYGDAAYTVINGSDSEWNGDGTTDLTFTADGNFEKFKDVEIDGNLVDKKNYDVKSGSTIVTLKGDYLKTLEKGIHTITFLYTDGEISANFKILEGTINKDTTVKTPETVDNKDTAQKTPENGGKTGVIFIVILGIVLCIIAFSYFYFKKRRK